MATNRNIFLDYFQYQIKLFKFVGVCFFIETDAKYKRFFKIYYVCFPVLMWLSLILNCFFEKNPTIKAATGFEVSMFTIAIYRIHILSKNKKIIFKLLYYLSDFDGLAQDNSGRTMTNDTLRFDKKIRKVVLFLVVVGVILCFIKPFFIKRKTHPVESWYPFNAFVFPVYQFCFVHQLISTCTSVFVVVAGELFEGGLMNFTCLQCDLLCYYLQSMNQYNIKYRLKECIRFHRKIIR